MINQETSQGEKGQNTPRLPGPETRRLPLGNARKELGIFGLLVVLCLFTGIRNPQFFGVYNLQDLARLVGIYGIFSIGAGIVIITGGIDLSVGSVFALEGVLAAMMLDESHWPALLAVIACLAVTMGLGLFHGLLITRVPLQPFIVTLCGLLFYRGLARFIANDQTKGFGSGEGFEGLMNLATGKLLGVPAPFIVMIVIAVIMWIVLHRSIYGRYLYAVGRNEEAARYSGINSQRVIASAYVVSGALAGITGLLLAFYTNSISPSSHGNSYELYGIAAAVLGGCSLRGGEGSIIGILIGTALLQVLQNLVNLLGIPSSLNFAVVGAVILLGVITDEVIKRRSARKVKA
ncbi:MAG: ABC transporter permease [Armatimonadetes bacterium]|nr:ABC transporter permease [Armatimonadota bacterium]